MNYKLTKAEQETIILFNQEEENAIVYTHSLKLKQQLKRLAANRTSFISLKQNNCWGGLTFELPKSWIKIRPNRVVSEQEREIRANRLRRNLK